MNPYFFDRAIPGNPAAICFHLACNEQAFPSTAFPISITWSSHPGKKSIYFAMFAGTDFAGKDTGISCFANSGATTPSGFAGTFIRSTL